MTRYVLRRGALLLLTLVVTSIVIFALMRATGGNIASIMLGPAATPDSVARVTTKLGLDKPVLVQYFDWAGGLLHGDLGKTYVSDTSVGSTLVSKLPVTGPLVIGALLIEILIAIPLGTYAARFNGRPLGSVLGLGGQVGIAIPTFWAGILLSSLVGVRLGWLPTGGWVPWSQDPWGAIRSLILPCLALGLVEAAGASRYVRTAVLNVLNEDYVRMARATGMSRSGALLKVGLRNAALPIVTVFGLQAASLVGGAVVIEHVFSLPGLSSMILTAVSNREVVEVQSTVMVLVAFVVLVNVVVDITYGLLDPRVRKGA